MTRTIRMNDKDLLTSVTDELTCDPSIDAAHLVVSADDGVVTLSGDVASLHERHAAKRAALRVSGVSALADDVVVRDAGGAGTMDADLTEMANRMLKAAVDVPDGAVRAAVRDHTITLSGTVTWQYQREAAFRAVMYLRGVTAVANTISLTSTAPVSRVKTVIEAAVARNAPSGPT
jgi:osmotically-inducible protein OsmY